MRGDGRNIIVPIADVGGRGTLARSVGALRLWLRRRPLWRSSERINDVGVPCLIHGEKPVEILKVIHAGRGVDIRPIEHGKGIPGPGSPISKRWGDVLKIKDSHAKEGPRNDALIVVNEIGATGRKQTRSQSPRQQESRLFQRAKNLHTNAPNPMTRGNEQERLLGWPPPAKQ